MLQRVVHLLPRRVRAALRRVPILVRGYRWLQEGGLTRERGMFVLLVLASIGIGVAATFSETWFPASALVLIVLAGGLALRVRALSVLLVVVVAVLVADALRLASTGSARGSW